MAAELVAHGGKQLVREIRVAARAEALVERGRQHMGRDAFVDGGLDRPASLTGVGNVALKGSERGVARESIRRKVEQPRGDDAAAPPDLCYLGEIEIIAIV